MSSPPWRDVVMVSGSGCNNKEREVIELRPCSSGLGQGFCIEVPDFIGILKFETISKFSPREVPYDFDTSLGQMFKI